MCSGSFRGVVACTAPIPGDNFVLKEVRECRAGVGAFSFQLVAYRQEKLLRVARAIMVHVQLFVKRLPTLPPTERDKLNIRLV